MVARDNLNCLLSQRRPPFVRNASPSALFHFTRDLNALLQRLSTDLKEAKEAAETGAKRADASALEVGARQEESRRLGEALARTESRVAATER